MQPPATCSGAAWAGFDARFVSIVAALAPRAAAGPTMLRRSSQLCTVPCIVASFEHGWPGRGPRCNEHNDSAGVSCKLAGDRSLSAKENCLSKAQEVCSSRTGERAFCSLSLRAEVSTGETQRGHRNRNSIAGQRLNEPVQHMSTRQ